MPVTGLRGRQILDGDVFRNDLNITTSGSAVTRRIIAGTNITISSTGVDTGTGDVTINASSGGGTWIKDAVRAATTANITLSATQTIDGIALAIGDRVLVKDQTTTSQNGIYIVASGAWTRSTDSDTSLEVAASQVAVISGTTNGGTTWDTDFKSTDTIGTTAIIWHRVIDTGYNIPVSQGGTGATSLTGVLIGNGTSAVTAVAGTASQLLRRNAGNTAYEFFTPTFLTAAITSLGGLTAATQTFANDTNVTITSSTSTHTLGWAGQLAVSRGGTGASTLTGVLIGNGTSAVTAVAGTASQLLRRNAGNTAYEFFTHDFASTAGATFTGQIISTRANNTADAQGQIYLNGTGGNRIDWSAAGVAAPSYTTRSVGTKLVLYPSVNASQVDYGFGIESDTLWASVAVNGGSFKWYGGTQLNMHLSGQNLLVGSGVSVGSGRLTVGAAVGGTSLYLTDATNSTLIISHPALGVTRFTNGASVLWMQESGGNVTIGNSTSSVARLFVYNDNLLQPTAFVQTQSTLTTFQDTIPLKFTDLYNSGANGHNLFFNSSASSGSWEYNITKTYGGILTFGVSSAAATLTRHLYLYSSGQLRFANYTTTTSFTGTAVGVLAFTSDGSIITIATPGGGSGLTGSGTTNYIPKFTGSTSVGNSILFDNGTDIGMGTATPTTTTNYTTLHINGASGGLLRFSYAGNNTGTIYGSSAETGINSPSQINLYVSNVNVLNASSTTIDVTSSEGFAIGNRSGRRRIQYNSTSSAFSTLNDANGFANFNAATIIANAAGAQFQLANGGTLAGIYMSGANNLMFVTDWNTGANGLVIDVGNGITRVRALGANGGYLQFQRSTSTDYGYVGNSSGLFGAGFNANTDLGIRSEGATNFGTGSTALMRLQTSGQLRLTQYTATTSFTGTAVGVLAFTSDGSLITIATPSGGSSQWTTNGSDIYYNTGNVGIGATTPLQELHLIEPSGSDTMIRFEQTSQRTYDIGSLSSSTAFTIRDVSASANRLQILSTGQLVLPSYTALTSFSYSSYQGQLGFNSSGNIIPVSAAFYNINFLAAGNLILTNMASALQFFNNQTSYIARADLIGYKRVRLHVLKGGTAGAAASKIILRYRTTFSITTTDYSDIGTSEVSVALNTTNAYLSTGWITLAAGAQGDVYIALMQSGGDGAADPIVGNIYAEFDYRI